MTNSKNQPNGAADQVVERFQRARDSFNGSWRCRPCAGDFISPSPRARQKGREQKKVLKPDISKDPLFLKPTQPTPAREDDRLAIEWQQDGHAKENEKKKSLNRGKIDGQLQPASQQDPGGRKDVEEKDATDRESQGGKMNGELQSPSQNVDLVSPEKPEHGVSEDDFDPLKLGTPEEFSVANSTKPSFPADQSGTQHLESSGAMKSGLNINIPHSDSYSLHEAECDKVKALEENESPVSVLQGIPDLETPKGEKDGKVEVAWKDPAANIISHLCAVSKLETAQLERPSEDVQTNSIDFFEISNPGKELGTPQVFSGSLQEMGHSGDGLKEEGDKTGLGKEIDSLHSNSSQTSVHSEAHRSGHFEIVDNFQGESLYNAKNGEVETKHDGFPNSERLDELLAGKGSTLHGMAAASLQGTGEDGSSQLYPDHPDYTELRPNPHHGEENAQIQPNSLHREESNSFKIGVFSVPHVLVVGAITVVSLLGKAATH